MQDPGARMDKVVRLFAARGRLDFGARAVVVLLALGLLNWLRDIIEHPRDHDGYLNNLFEAAFVGLLPVVLALLLIGHLDRLQRGLAAAARTDPLTGLPNRRAFFEAVPGVLPVPGGVLLMLDADHFKRVNDGLGHGAGDECLVRIARLLRDHVRAGDIVARMGGEEFALLLVGARREDARLIGERLVAGVVLDADAAGGRHTVTLSAGAVCTNGAADVAVLLSRADAALYEAKAAGRACLVFAEADGPQVPPAAIARRSAA